MSRSSGRVETLAVAKGPCGPRRSSLSIVVNRQDDSWLGFAAGIPESMFRIESRGCPDFSAIVGSAKFRRCIIETVFKDRKF